MAPGEYTQGRRREDVRFGYLPDNVEPGDYWRYLGETGKPLVVEGEATNLTGEAWGFSAPNGCGFGTLMKHTVREHDDGTASVAPGDGSSNSVLIDGGDSGSWHGYLERGVWREA